MKSYSIQDSRNQYVGITVLLVITIDYDSLLLTRCPYSNHYFFLFLITVESTLPLTSHHFIFEFGLQIILVFNLKKTLRR